MYDWNYFDTIQEYHPIADANNLLDAFKLTRQDSGWKPQVQRFRWNLLGSIGALQDELDNLQNGRPNAYKTSSCAEFFVQERGHVRPITGLQVRDRVVRHALNDLYLVPHIRPHLIYDNGASLKGKGVQFSRNRLIAHLEQYYREHGSNDGYILIMDYSKFYDNLRHRIALDMVQQYESDPFSLQLVEQCVHEFRVDVSYMDAAQFEKAMNEKFNSIEYRLANYPKTGEKFLDKSVSVGDQTSQIIAIAYPTRIDQLVKTVYRQKYYARYMDDSYVIAETKEELEELLKHIQEEATKLGIIINTKKTYICKISRTFKFLQFKYYLNERGHVIVRIHPKTVTRMRRKLTRLAIKVRNGERDLSRAEELFRSWIGAYALYMSRAQIENIVSLYREHFGGGLDQWLSKKIRWCSHLASNSQSEVTEQETGSPLMQ